MTDHPITPPPELVQQWRAAASNVPATLSTDPGGRHDYIDFIATRAAQWGADQELEACCEWMANVPDFYTGSEIDLRAARRRPMPLSLAETATQELDEAVMRGDCITTTDAMPHLRAALKRLAELEQQATP